MTLIERAGPTLTITLDEPRRRNPITPRIADEIRAALASAQTDDVVRAIVLTGSDGTFCSGGDLEAMPPSSSAAAAQRLDTYAALVRAMADSRHPLIAAVEGVAAGIGVSIATHCDVVIAADDAEFLLPFSRLGLFPDGGVLLGLTNRVGWSRARSLLLLGDPVSAREAVRLGLADQLSEPGTALQAARELGDRISRRSAGSIQRIRQEFAAMERRLDDALATERRHQSQLYFTDDFAARRAAFLRGR